MTLSQRCHDLIASQPDWDELARELGSASANSLRVVWGTTKKRFIEEHGQAGVGSATMSTTQATPKK